MTDKSLHNSFSPLDPPPLPSPSLGGGKINPHPHTLLTIVRTSVPSVLNLLCVRYCRSLRYAFNFYTAHRSFASDLASLHLHDTQSCRRSLCTSLTGLVHCFLFVRSFTIYRYLFIFGNLMLFREAIFQASPQLSRKRRQIRSRRRGYR